MWDKMIKESELKDGISIIIPTYKGEKYISKLLDSLISQTIDFNLFEAIFIVNGEIDSTPEIIEKYQEKCRDINIVLTDSPKGVSNARNKGIEISERKYTIFIDDDDYISNNYLKVLYEYAQDKRIVIGSFYDVDENTGEIKESYLSPPLLENVGVVENPYENIRGILTITTDKLIPTKYVKEFSFNPNLNNGVDIAFYCDLYTEYDFEFYIVDKNRKANYYRLWREGSVSRKELSYEFYVNDSLKLMVEIDKSINKAKTNQLKNFIKSLSGGRVYNINKYLIKNPEDYTKVLKDILSYNFNFFPSKYLTEDLNNLDNEERELIISYAFSPTNITTSNSVAKRILTEKKNIDVIHASLNDLDKDYELEKIINQFIIKRYEIENDFDVSWSNIKNFVDLSLERLSKEEIYNKIYSRANFVHSHFLALEYKLLHPKVYWRAEFSDPLIEAYGRRLSSEIEDEEYVNRINNILKKDYENIKVTDDVNCICEYLTCIFADEVIFTNPNQKDVMIDLNNYDIENLCENKTTINPHPTLDKKYYYIKDSNYDIDSKYINFAYFGTIYSKRAFEDFSIAFENIDKDIRENIRLHIFTSTKILFEQYLSPEIYEKTTINPNISYLEFLNLTTKFDVLLVEDSYSKEDTIKNPYLPSKISDYNGSGNDIWAVCEKGSIMDNMDIKYKSYMNNSITSINTLNKILNDKLSTNIEPRNYDIEKIYKKRIYHLTQKINELVDVCHSEFKKDKMYEAQINELNQIIQNLEQENSQIKNSNSWKMTKNLRKIGKKFK